MNNTNSILEVFWLIVAIFTAFMAVYNLSTKGWSEAKMFFIMALLAFLLYLARRTLRKKNRNKSE